MNEQRTQGSGDRLVVLAVDTSTAALAAALVRGGEVLRRVQSLAERNHSVHTVSTVRAMLAECGVTPEELDGIAIGRGPGSYTGMRIAVSLGKTLAWAWNKPLVGVSSLEALAYGAWRHAGGEAEDDSAAAAGGSAADSASGAGVDADAREATEAGASAAKANARGAASADAAGAERAADNQAPSVSDQGPVWIVPIMDARRGQVYTASFEARPESRSGAEPPAGTAALVFTAGEAGPPAAGTWTRLAKDGIRLMRDWVDELAAAIGAAEPHQRPTAVWIAGELALHEAEADRLQAICPGIQVRKRPVWLEGSAVAALGAARLAAGESDDVHAFAPNYTQLTEAEVKLQERTAKEAAAEGAVHDEAH